MTKISTDIALKGASKWRKRVSFTVYIFLGFVAAFSGFPYSYVFIARDVKYRCLLPQCENTTDTYYNPSWLEEFIPFKGDSPDSCHRYPLMNNSCSRNYNFGNDTLQCDEFVYKTNDITIVHDFDIHCEENIWKLTIVGTISVCGEFVSLAYAGFISDKYGRKILIMTSVLLSMICGILKSVSVSYVMYVLMEFLDTASGAGMYSAAFISAIEFAPPDKRNLANICFCCFYPFGQAIMGLTAWLTPTWRVMLRFLYTPGIISIAFYWSIPESSRWLQANNEIEEINSLAIRCEDIKNKPENGTLPTIQESVRESENLLSKHLNGDGKENLLHVIKNRVLLLRIIHCCFTWMSSTFLYFGLTFNSVALAENIYLSFILSALIEIPGYIVYYYANMKIGRRWVTSLSFVFAGAACLAVGFVPEDKEWLKLGLYLLGKCCATISYTVVYVITTELFPTNCRHSVLALCALIGRIGLMVAPQIPLLTRVWELLPLILFAVIGSTCGTLALLFPETMNTKLPDTIQEAINIGTQQNLDSPITPEELIRRKRIPQF